MNHKEVLEKAIQAAGALIKSRFNGPFVVEHKDGINNLVTEIDKLAEKTIIDIIESAFPDHSIIGEEGGTKDRGSAYQWIIDPIDGTVNFAHGIPICCVSIGLRKDNEMLMGSVFNPMMDELFFAEKGKGATLNGEPIKVSQKSDFARACLVTGFPYQWPEDDKEHPVKTFERLVMRGIPVRRLGSAAIDLCWVACGRFDGFWEYNLNAWDVAAGYLIVEEAGGRVSDFEGNASDVFNKQTLATNGLIHEELRQTINAQNNL